MIPQHFNALEIWAIILVVGAGTFLLRFSFIGLVGAREMPEWVLRHLRYTAVAIIPGLIAPLVLWPAATGGQPDPARLAAAAATVGVTLVTKNVLLGILAGGGTLALGLWLLP